MDKVNKVCKECGGTDVAKDAYAVWLVDDQKWGLGSFYDYEYCHDCEEETTILEVSLEEQCLVKEIEK